MKTFSIDKAAVDNNETIAQNQACIELQVQADQLEAAHTETQFVFNVKQDSTGEQGTGEQGTEEEEVHEEIPTFLPELFEVEKSFEKEQAIAQAMEHFETFEGNLQISETETHYIFHKVR